MSYSQKNAHHLKWSSFLSGLSFYTPVAPLFFLDRGVSLSMIVIAQAAYSVSIILSEVPTGVIGDKFGHRRSIILGGICEAAGIGMILLLPNINGLFVGYILLGIGASFQSGSMEALLYESAAASNKTHLYKKHLSQILSNDTLAFAISTATVGLVYGLYGSSVLGLLIVGSLCAKVAATAVTFRLVNVSGKSPAPPDSALWQTFTQGIKHIRSETILTNITIVKMLTLTAQYVILSSYQSYFRDAGTSPYMIGFVLTLGGLANAVAMRHIHRIEKRLSLDKVVIIFGILMAVTYSVFSVATTPWALVAIFVILQAQYNLLDPIMSDYINDKTQTGVRATVLSSISLIRAISNTASKLLLGLAIAGVGVGGMLRFQAVYLLIGASLSYWLLKRCGCVYRLSSGDENEGLNVSS